MEESFKIRSYGYGELALLYFPNCNKNSASTQLSRWLRQNENLKNQLTQLQNELTLIKENKVTQLENGYYDYDEESVFKIIKKDVRINVIYARVSTYKQKNDLQNQIDKINDYCNENKINTSRIEIFNNKKKIYKIEYFLNK